MPGLLPQHALPTTRGMEGGDVRRSWDQGFAAAALCAIVFGVWFFSTHPKSCLPIDGRVDLSALLPVVSGNALCTS